MKVKLLKRLRKKWNPYRDKNYWEEEYFSFYYTRLAIRECVLADISKHRLWYKLLTTLTHKKDVDKT